MRSRQFGGKLTSQLLAAYERSSNWRDGKFQNLENTELSLSLTKIPGLLYKQFTNRQMREPEAPLPVEAFSSADFMAPSATARIIWYGHSVVLMRLSGLTILIDPMLGPDAAPIAPIQTKRFSPDTLQLIDDFPEIDLLLLTHDHYDHLDFASIDKLKHKTKRYFVALGVKRHLVHWGIDPALISEFDWWDHDTLGDIAITFTPTRHFSGRGLRDRACSLWGGWVFRTPTENIWFSGDGGYGQHFQEIGKQLGPFDFAFMECGQYNENWSQIHMYPEESVTAALEAGAQKAMPVHWAGFSLAQHSWTEPAERYLSAAQQQGLAYSLPPLGRQFQLADSNTEKWWIS